MTNLCYCHPFCAHFIPTKSLCCLLRPGRSDSDSSNAGGSRSCCTTRGGLVVVLSTGDVGQGWTVLSGTLGRSRERQGCVFWGGQPLLQGSFCIGVGEVDLVGDQSQGEHAGEDKALVGSWRWEKKGG